MKIMAIGTLLCLSALLAWCLSKMRDTPSELGAVLLFVLVAQGLFIYLVFRNLK